MLQRELDPSVSPDRLHAALEDAHDRTFLLESADGPRQRARYSFLGFDPAGIVRARGPDLEIEGELPDPRKGEDPLAYLDRVRRRHAVPPGPAPFQGGFVGYVGYETVEQLEPVPPRDRPRSFPDLEMGFHLDGVVYDHEAGDAAYVSHGPDRVDELREIMDRTPPDRPLQVGEATESTTQREFEDAVREAKERIRAGEIFQVVLSRRTSFPAEGSLTGFYRALKRTNPSPYMFHQRFGDREIVGASPEMLVRVHDDRVAAFPIAGTRPLGDTPDETEALARELREDPKERAEHAMLVDLARNDVGRVSTPGTVEVPDLARVERYSHVQHLVSQVEGDLRDDLTAVDALRAAFPAGTVSGAPKVRAMEIIRELEPTARGPYAGAVGYLSLDGNLDTAIVIRSLVRDGGTAHVQAGAGIVDDSVPAREHEETRSKQEALLALVRERRRRGTP